MGPLMILIGLAIVVFSMLSGLLDVNLSTPVSILIGAAGLALTAVGSVTTFMSFYRRTSADMAFVRTGQGGKHVVLDSGILVLPFFHKIVDINLKTMKLGVNPRGANALITRDNLRANVLAQFYIRVQADTEHILNAARSLGENSVNEAAVEELVSEKLTSALRAIASQMDLFEIHTQRDLFADRVKEHVKDDLEANGLLLESVTISELDQTDPTELSDNNVFDAQGKRKITEITAAAAVERNTLERDAEQARKSKDVETRRSILEMERQQAEAEATQATEVAKVRAGQEREAQEAQIVQQKLIELANIEKQKQVQAQEIARQQAVEIARMQQEQAVQTAAVEREQGVALAERQKQIAVAEQETLRARAEEAALLAQAERERAEQQVASVMQIAEAEREANKRLIAARQQIDQDKLRAQTTADVEAYTAVKQAEAEREAADQQAEATLRIAQADATARELAARGEKAQQMVAVEVAREQVNIEQAKIAVERQQLENRQEFAQAGIQLEVQKLSIQADRDVQIEFAKALASFLSNGHMTLYGTPETAQQMLDNMAKGFGARSLVSGFLKGDPSGDNGVDALMAQVSGMVQPLVARATGSTPTTATETPATAGPAPVAADIPAGAEIVTSPGIVTETAKSA